MISYLCLNTSGAIWFDLIKVELLMILKNTDKSEKVFEMN